MEAAVVSASHGAMASLLGKLGDLLADKYKLVKGAKGRIMFLKAELESMHAFLKKMSDTEDPDEQDKCWAKQVRELSYDIDDSINEFMHRVERKSNSKPRGFKGFMERSMNLLTTMNTRCKIAIELEGLKSRVMEVSERRTRYKIDDVVSKPNSTTIDPRLLALHAETAGLVGIDGPRDELIELMSEEAVPAHQLKVLSIVGFGGLGKTTLANDIYRKLEGQFQCRAFVSVSQKPNIRKILRTILDKVGFPKDPNMETWDENELICALKSFLLDKRISPLTFEAGAMAKLERLELRFNVQGWDRYGAAPAGIEHLSCLKQISVDIGGGGARESHRRAAESALRNAVDMHQGRPTANIQCDNFMYVFDDVEDDRDEQEDNSGFVSDDAEDGWEEEDDGSCSS